MPNTAERRTNKMVQNTTGLCRISNCLICHKTYDGIREYKDCTVYYHKTGQGHDLTVPKEK
jgi:hypothetical protein